VLAQLSALLPHHPHNKKKSDDRGSKANEEESSG
jgi:hypothetical protein